MALNGKLHRTELYERIYNRTSVLFEPLGTRGGLSPGDELPRCRYSGIFAARLSSDRNSLSKGEVPFG